MEGCRDELCVVNSTVSVDVGSAEHIPHIRLFKMEDLRDILHASFKLVEGEEAIVVSVQLEEHLPHFG